MLRKTAPAGGADATPDTGGLLADVATRVADEDKRTRQRQGGTARLVNVAASVDSMDASILPAVFQALESDPAFSLSPASLGRLALCQSLAQALSSPVRGFLARP